MLPSRRYRPLLIAIVVALVLAIAGVVIVTTGKHASKRPHPGAACTYPNSPKDTLVADPSAPHGLFVFGGVTTAAAETVMEKYLVNQPDVCGVSIPVRWSAIDNGPGAHPRYNWESIIRQMRPWERAGKIVNLLFGGAGEGGTAQIDTPAYVQRQVTMLNCGHDTEPTPVFWQPGYEDNWKHLIAAAVSEFQGNPHIGYLRFGLGTATEGVLLPNLINGPNCGQLWDAQGYRTKWPAYNQSIIAFEGSLHSRVQLQVGLNDATNDPPMTEVASWASQYDIGLGIEGLRAADATDILSGHECRFHNWCRIFDQYAGKVPLHVQPLTPSTPAGGEAQTGPLPPLLEAGLRVHAQIFEIYLQDWLAAFDPGAPGYANFHTSYLAAFDNAAKYVGTASDA